MFQIEQVVELYRVVATSLPRDVEEALKNALKAEKEAKAREILKVIIDNASMARREELPMCQDTGVPIFYAETPRDWSGAELKKIIIDATATATRKIPLRPNAFDPLTGKELGNYPIIHFEEAKRPRLRLLLKGGGSENIVRVYKLPDDRLNAERDADGIRKCVLDAVLQAQGRGCPPYIVGVGVAGTLEEASALATRQLLRPLDEEAGPHAALEGQLLRDINKLEIGPMGLGGSTTALGVKLATAPRHPATFFVVVSFGCWATRRGEL